LRKLKEKGVLPPGADLGDLANYVRARSKGEQAQTKSLAKKPVETSGAEPTAIPNQLEILPRAGPEAVHPSVDGSARAIKDVPEKIVKSNGTPRRKRLKKNFNKAVKKGDVAPGTDFENWLKEREKRSNRSHEHQGEDEDMVMEEVATGDAADELTKFIGSPLGKSSKEESRRQNTLNVSSGSDVRILSSVTEETTSRVGSATPQGKGTAIRSKPPKPRKILYDDEGNSIPVYTGADDELEVDDQHMNLEAWK
jgi:hypothetical protein